MKVLFFFFLTSLSLVQLLAQPKKQNLQQEIDQRAAAITEKLIAWRRDIHQNPELGNREVRTSKLVADHLRALGMEVQTGVATTGVVGLLKGGLPGPVVALRADMDALPVTEMVDLPFASKAKGTYEGNTVGVMHACGHDTHVAILMATAQVLSDMKQHLRGTVKFIFQPAEEGAPKGERGGAEVMVEQGVMENPKVDAVFGLHVSSPLRTGLINYRPGPTMAAVDYLDIVVNGRQTHGARPWNGVDPIVISSQIVLGLQTIESRQVDVTLEPSIITVGKISGGVRNNIIPDSVNLVGTIRTFNAAMRDEIHMRIRRTAENIAAAAGGTATVRIRKQYPATINDSNLTYKMLPTLERVAGKDKVGIGAKVTGSEDFSFYQQKAPGLFFFLGITPPTQDLKTAAVNHSPLFYVDEAGLPLGVRALANLTIDYMEMHAPKK
jgi:amidohydrolase